MPARPNLLILMADQLTAGVLPAYGAKVAKTPHLDELAETGVVFESFYCNSPLCAPSAWGRSGIRDCAAGRHPRPDHAHQTGLTRSPDPYQRR
jgi:hypothetical protein